jgi:predicted ATP-dependent serine protease
MTDRFLVTLCRRCGYQTQHRWVGRTLSCDECYAHFKEEQRLDDDDSQAYSRAVRAVEERGWLY